MKIGVFGSGNVGQTLGTGFAGFGHKVKMGSRSPESDTVRGWKIRTGNLASSGTYAEAAAFADLAVLTTAWTGTENAIRMAGPKSLTGKIVIDVTNPLRFAQDTAPSLALGYSDSAGEQVQRWLPGAHIVKAFNTVGFAHMIHPTFQGGPPDMFICGDNASAKEKVGGFLKDFGWSVVDMGGIEASRLIEPLALVWITYGIRTGTWDHAFKFLKK